MSAVYQRSEIIEKVKAGILLPEQAEREAARLNVGPLAEDPDPAMFDPWRVERWPLAMVLAWIGWRDTESVCAAWPEYQAARFVWRPIGERWDLMHGEARTILGMIAQQEHDFDAGLMQDTILHAWEDLKAHLARGQISAIGRRNFNPSNAPPAIDPSEWPYVEISLDFTSDAGALMPFTNVLFRSDEIRTFWPDLNNPVSSPKNKGGAPPQFDWDAYAERFRIEVAERGFPEATNVKGWRRQADVEQWLHDLVQNDPGAERRTMSEGTARKAARRLMENFRQ